MVRQLISESRQAMVDLSRACEIAPQLVLACWCRGLLPTINDEYKTVIAAYAEGIRPAPREPLPQEAPCPAPEETAAASFLDNSADDDILQLDLESDLNRHSHREGAEQGGRAPRQTDLQGPKADAVEADGDSETGPSDAAGSLLRNSFSGFGPSSKAANASEAARSNLEKPRPPGGHGNSAKDKSAETRALSSSNWGAVGFAAHPQVGKAKDPTSTRRGGSSSGLPRKLRGSAWITVASALFSQGKYVIAALATVLLVYYSLMPHEKSNGLYPVSGTVYYNDEPAVGAIVEFSRSGADPLTQQTIMGMVAQDGSFTLACGNIGQGTPPGDYDVLIKWPQPSYPHDTFKERFGDPAHPLLHAVVKAEKKNQQLAPFELRNEYASAATP